MHIYIVLASAKPPSKSKRRCRSYNIRYEINADIGIVSSQYAVPRPFPFLFWQYLYIGWVHISLCTVLRHLSSQNSPGVCLLAFFSCIATYSCKYIPHIPYHSSDNNVINDGKNSCSFPCLLRCLFFFFAGWSTSP